MDRKNPQSQTNFILVMVITGLLLFVWPNVIHHFYPNADRHPVAVAAPAVAAAGPVASDPATLKPSREGGLTDPGDGALETGQLAKALSGGARVPVAAPGLSGSINLAGGVVDDLTLNRYRASLAKTSGPVRLFSPAGSVAQHFAQFGWTGAAGEVPDGNTLWQAPTGARLTPATPVTLTWASPAKVQFTLTYAIDADYLITVTQSAINQGAAPAALASFAVLDRTDRTASIDSWQIHSGPFGAYDGAVSFGPKYKDVQASGSVANNGHTDWLGFTDIYWMSALVPDAHAAGTTSDFRAVGGGLYLAHLAYAPQTLAPGATASTTTRLFAGAKESVVLDKYEAAGIPKFGYAIDWGWFWFFEKPIFGLLRGLFSAIGNFGFAIMALTLCVRLVMFPIAQRQFASMAAMRALQPKMKALQDRHKEDKPKLQEETMKLYKEEGANPLAGCLPTFLQIPVFFALYKVLQVAIEMRQAPFMLWIHDLSAPDPAHILNLFGLIPWNPPGFLAIGLLSLMLGVTSFVQIKLTPASADPTQQQVMTMMPWLYMFMMSSFASGLLIYWITSNCLTILQQWYLYRRHPGLRAQAAAVAVARK